MMKNEFLQKVRQTTSRLSKEEQEDIIRDLEEHFYFGKAEGKSEEEIVAGLGSPEKMGRALVATYRMEQVQEKQSIGNVFQAVWAVIGLSLFNVIIVLGPFLALIGVILAGWLTGASFIVSPVLYCISALLFPPGFAAYEFFIAITLAGAGIFLCIGMYYVTIYVTRAFMQYVHWNYRLMKGENK